jgi:outer membrane lipoprotein-sorting protein
MMLNGKMILNAVLALLLGLLLQTGTAAAAEGAGGASPEQADLSAFLNELGKKVSDFKTLKTDFVQEKEMAMFKEKIVLKGRIYIRKPNELAWHVDSPLRYSVLITDKFIRQWDEDTNQVQELSLAKNPIFQNVLKQLTVWFSGEYGTLLLDNEMRLVSSAPLVIEFKPLDKSISKKVIKTITITFRDDRTYLQQIRIQELTGDVTTIRFTNTRFNVPLDKKNFEVHPVRDRSSLTIEGAFAQAALPMTSGGRQEPMIFSNGVQGHV